MNEKDTKAAMARKAAVGIEADCLDRRGIKNQFYDLDPDIREVIIQSWMKIILANCKW